MCQSIDTVKTVSSFSLSYSPTIPLFGHVVVLTVSVEFPSHSFDTFRLCARPSHVDGSLKIIGSIHLLYVLSVILVNIGLIKFNTISVRP